MISVPHMYKSWWEKLLSKRCFVLFCFISFASKPWNQWRLYLLWVCESLLCSFQSPVFWFPWWSENRIINLDFSAVVFCIEINTPEERRDFLFLAAALTGQHWSYPAWPDLLMTFYNTITTLFLSLPKFYEFRLFLDFFYHLYLLNVSVKWFWLLG